MRGAVIRAVSTAAAFTALLVVSAAAPAAPPPASAFGRIPAVVDAALSPNGQHVAILGGVGDKRMISIATIDSPAMPRLDLGDVETIDVRWAGDDYVMATVAYWDKEGPRLTYRIERHITVNTKAEVVSRFLNSGTNGGWFFRPVQPILQVTAGPQPRVVVEDLAGTNAPQDGIWLVDPATGRGKLLERGDGDTYAWGIDLSGEARVRVDGDKTTFWTRPKGRGQWAPLIPEEAARKDVHFLGYSDPDDGAYLRRGDKIVLRPLAGGDEKAFADASETSRLVWDRNVGSAVGVVSLADRHAFTWTDKDIAAAHAVLSRAFKTRDVDLRSWSRDRTRFVARVVAPNAPAAWYLYDRTRKEVSLLGDEYPELKGAAFGATRWLTYKARDGLEIPAYVTMPAGAAAEGAKAPLVVLPHGGPQARDSFDFDYMVQFLASRGYAVLQPQFRGSYGFGEAFEKAGHGEWAGKMQTDLLDGIKALADRGDIDPRRVCIVGSSFGGYAALAGVAFHPHDYRCAASIAGIADLGQLLLEDGRAYGVDNVVGLKTMLGGSSKETLDGASPLRRLSDIRAPVLLIHGDKDTVVQLAQSQRMADALKAAGKPYQLIVLPDENHYLTRAATRTQTLEALEAFLAKNLPVN